MNLDFFKVIICMSLKKKKKKHSPSKEKFFLEKKGFNSVYRKIQLWGHLGSPTSQRAWNISSEIFLPFSWITCCTLLGALSCPFSGTLKASLMLWQYYNKL